MKYKMPNPPKGHDWRVTAKYRRKCRTCRQEIFIQRLGLEWYLESPITNESDLNKPLECKSKISLDKMKEALE